MTPWIILKTQGTETANEPAKPSHHAGRRGAEPVHHPRDEPHLPMLSGLLDLRRRRRRDHPAQRRVGVREQAPQSSAPARPPAGRPTPSSDRPITTRRSARSSSTAGRRPAGCITAPAPRPELRGVGSPFSPQAGRRWRATARRMRGGAALSGESALATSPGASRHPLPASGASGHSTGHFTN